MEDEYEKMAERHTKALVESMKQTISETQMPTKICGPNLVGILNAAGFYRKKEWVGLTEQQIKKILSDSKCWIGDDCSMPNVTYIIRAVEKAHGIGEK